MSTEDLARFTQDLRIVLGLDAVFQIDRDPKCMRVIRIGNVDFFLTARGYDGWDASLAKTGEKNTSTKR